MVPHGMRAPAERVLDGHETARRIREACVPLVADRAAGGRRPCLAVVHIGSHPAALVHVEAYRKEATTWGLEVRDEAFGADATLRRVGGALKALGRDGSVDGVVVVRPLPEHLGERAVQELVPPAKDVEGVHPETLGRCVLGRPGLVPATAGAVVRLVDAAGVPVRNACVVVVAGPDAPVLPAGLLLGRRDADVTFCRPATADLARDTVRADILVVEAHRPGLVTAAMIRPGAVVVDAGVNAVPDPARRGRLHLVGDVDFEAVCPVARAVTPVPGGVGAVALAVLLENVLRTGTSEPAAQDPAQLPLFHY